MPLSRPMRPMIEWISYYRILLAGGRFSKTIWLDGSKYQHQGFLRFRSKDKTLS